MPKEREPRGLTATVEKKPCQCGSDFPVGKDGACFDCRVEEWPIDQLKQSRHFGPAIIGKAQYQYVQSFLEETQEGRFGPALLGKLVPSQVRVPEPKPAA